MGPSSPGDGVPRGTTPGSRRQRGDVLLAHGRDPFFPGWTDTLQLDYANPATHEAMAAELLSVAARCDGVRCDMAMLVLPDIFERTWGRRPTTSFWPDAHRARPGGQSPEFTFMAEVYWDLEWTIMEQGFDYAYDKRLYDRLRAGPGRPVRDHLRAGLDYQSKLAQFLENHDEPRAAATFPPGRDESAGDRDLPDAGPAVLPPGSVRGPDGPGLAPPGPRAGRAGHARIGAFYDRLLAVLRGRPARRRWGSWNAPRLGRQPDLGRPRLAWEWRGGDGRRFLVAVNLGPTAGQCYVRSSVDGIAGETVRLADRMSATTFERDVAELAARGLYLDLHASGYNVFEVVTAPVEAPVARPPSAPPRRTRAAKRARSGRRVSRQGDAIDHGWKG